MNSILLSANRYILLLGMLVLAMSVLILARNVDKPIVQSAGQNIWLWRFIIFKYANGSFIVWASSVMAAHLFDTRTESWLGVYLAVSKSWEMLLNQDISKLKEEIKAAIGNTQFFNRLPQLPLPPEPPKP